MFDNVRFSGEISLGAFSIAVTQLVLACALYLRELVVIRKEERKRQEQKDLLLQDQADSQKVLTGKDKS
jgi:hypothetical protein